MKALTIAALVAVSLYAGADWANAGTNSYRTPAHNYNQNNWVISRG